MTLAGQLHIEYGADSTTECGGELFEIPTMEVVGGDIVELRIWARNHDVLAPYDMFRGTRSMGFGQNITTTADEIIDIVDFAETTKHQAEYPIQSIVSIEALTEIVIIDSITGDVTTWATKGETVTSKFSLKGYSCIQVNDGNKLYGSVRLIYIRPPYYKLWEWTVPVGSEGMYWFFIYKNDIVKNKFSIELPDLTEGPVDLRNISIFVSARSGGAFISDASVYIDTVYVGKTNSNGMVLVNNIQVGTHAIRVTAVGFQDTDLDSLYNDFINVY